MDEETSAISVHVEIELARECKDKPVIEDFIKKVLIHSKALMKFNKYGHESDGYRCDINESDIRENANMSVILNNIKGIQIFSPVDLNHVLDKSLGIQCHFYKLDGIGAQQEELEGEENVTAATHWLLPSKEFAGLWDSLVYDTDVKEDLISYASAILTLADKGADRNFVAWNQVVLLHGPPGTGKTSLCRAFAQKLRIRLGDRYKYGQLCEINAHSLFSKWFSESGKLVQRMFDSIHSIVEDKENLVFVLIDEVESLTAARKGGANEPSDAVRVVNAVLTQLDKLKSYPNVLVLTTSNITGCIDLAFVDRADIKRFIGNPNKEAIYGMLRGSIDDLIRIGVIQNAMNEGADSRLRKISDRATEFGYSGRGIRKLPVFAIQKGILSCRKNVFEIEEFLGFLEKVVSEKKTKAENGSDD